LLFVAKSTRKNRAGFQFRGFEESPVTVDKFSRRQFLGTGGIGVFGVIASRANAWSKQNHHFTMYVGTYTSGKSEGIYGYHVPSISPRMIRFTSSRSVNPSFLAIDESKSYLYAVNEVGEYAGKPGGGVSAFKIEEQGSLRLLNEQATLGADPCYVTIDRKRKNLLVANYTGGSVTVLPIRPDGTLSMATDVRQHEGSGPKEQQKGPHAHCVILDRSEQYAFVADLGIDKIMIYRYDSSKGKLLPNKQPFAELQAGAGPRHLTFHPNGKFLYAINELDSTITAFDYNKRNGTLAHIDTISTLPGDFSGISYCADVHIHPSGKFLYGSNRGHNSIVVFEIDQLSGKLKLVQHISTQGDWPRNFVIHSYGYDLWVANQRSDNIVGFKIDQRTGQLSPNGIVEQIPSPVCLKFL
jgi:6-phosphogluconolactonase